MKSLIQALSLGLIGAVAVFTSTFFQLPTWILFIAWISYYLFGATPRKAGSSFIQQSLGILIGMLIQFLGTNTFEVLNQFSSAFAVFLVISLLFFVSKLKHLNQLPAYFLGITCWFGSSSAIQLSSFFQLTLALLVGYLFAWISVTIQLLIEQQYSNPLQNE